MRESTMSVFGTRTTVHRRSYLTMYYNVLDRLYKEAQNAITEKDRTIHLSMYFKYIIQYSEVLLEQPGYRQLLWNKIQTMRNKSYHVVLTPLMMQIEKIIISQIKPSKSFN
jgi:hypothetical protein